MPAVSVVMVFHRDTPFLRPAIGSVLGQTLRDLELVLVDNGTGLSVDALGPLGHDSRVTWVRLPRDDGIGVANNAGVLAARGEFIALHDSDDLSEPHRLERQVATLRADPTLGFVSALADRIDDDGRPLPGRVFTLTEPGDFLAYSQYAAPVINPLATGRRELFTSTLFRPEFRYAGDLDFLARVPERWRIAVLPEVLMQYRVHPTQTTQSHLAHIAQSRGIICLLAARRRAGRGEDLGSIRWMSDGVGVARHIHGTAAQCIREGLVVPAAYLARFSLSVERTFGAVAGAARIAMLSWLRARGDDRAMVVRMFRSGPVRALRVKVA